LRALFACHPCLKITGASDYTALENYLIRSELVTTSTLLAAMAAAAYNGVSRPVAAIGKPIML